MTDNNDYPDEEYQEEYQEQYQEYSDEEYQDESEYSEDSDQIHEGLEDTISSYNREDISLESIQMTTEDLRNAIADIKDKIIPPIDEDIGRVNLFIDKKRLALEKAKKATVLINDMSDNVEFVYSDRNIIKIEEEIKDLLNERYKYEKERFKVLEELEELEAREIVASKVLLSYDYRAEADELNEYSNQVIDEIYFNIEDYGSVTAVDEETLDFWANNWNIVTQMIGRVEGYQKNIEELKEYFNEIKPRLEDKDPETKFVHSELDFYIDLDDILISLHEQYEEKLMSSIASLYEMASNYELGYDYLPENKPHCVSIINKYKSTILNIKSLMDTYKLDYKDFRKSLNNIFVLLNKILQTIENQQKNIKLQQDARVKKIRDIIALISRTQPEALRNSNNEINNMINSLANLSALDAQMEALQYFFSLRAKYPVEEETVEDLVSKLNYELDKMNIMEIDLMCKILFAKYEPKRGIFIDYSQPMPKAQTQSFSQPEPVERRAPEPQSQTKQSTSQGTANLVGSSKAKTGNLDFLGNMYMKEAQRSKGEWAVKSYIKAIDAFIKCAEAEEDNAKKQSFLKFALKCARDSITEKESSETLIAYANCYKLLAEAHTGKISAEALAKIGDTFVSAGKMFLREENIQESKKAFLQANEYYERGIRMNNSDEIKMKSASIQKFLK
ncbi:MAG: hypothetical protein U0457_06845 [Candidatus Sericytochromatia bacterium]